MSPLDVSSAVAVLSAAEFGRLLGRTDGGELVVSIHKKSSGKQAVTFDELLEAALCHGWVDTQTKGIDAERYAIRFARRRPGSNWSATNREIARRLIAAGRMTPAGRSVLPDDL